MTTGGAVLVVDDDPTVRSSTVEIVRGAGYAVEEAANTEEAVAILAGGAVEAVILDLRMPGRGGRGVLEELGLHGPPVVLVTGFPLASDASLRNDERVFTVLGKPCKPRDLLDAVAGALGRGVRS
jgi:CheY-like chemotaxis protein